MCTCTCLLVSDSFETPWTVVYQPPLSLGFCRQECRSGLPFPSPGDLPDPGIEPVSLVSPAWASGFFTTSASWEAQRLHYMVDRNACLATVVNPEEPVGC